LNLVIAENKLDENNAEEISSFICNTIPLTNRNEELNKFNNNNLKE
jgi:hypothetical protein